MSQVFQHITHHNDITVIGTDQQIYLHKRLYHLTETNFDDFYWIKYLKIVNSVESPPKRAYENKQENIRVSK